MNTRTNQNKAHAKVKIQPPVLVLIHIVLAFALTRFLALPWVVPPTLQISGLLLVFLGFLFGIAALLVFRRAHTTLNPHGSVSRLVTSGIYRFTRNPIYLGFLLMLIGIPLNSGSYWGILLAPIMVVLFNKLVIEHEEDYLAQKFGSDYESYKLNVRRWI
ncbi:MAG TPA: isoprenylcysteine carboxylmethyltransferase family protein [Anaerolineales bacterium]|nr:isoprenylcysteine carboxylmethyltransferase family protein [Anaerolineales bacterium]